MSPLQRVFDRSYGKEEWDMKTLIEKLNQKRKDALTDKKSDCSTRVQ